MIVGLDCRLVNKIQNTGISRYTEFLLEYYQSKKGITKIVLISNDNLIDCENCEVSLTKLKPYNILHFALFKSYIESLKIDLLHSPFYSSFLIKPKNLISILAIHDLMYKVVPTFFSGNRLVSILKKSYFDFIVKNSIRNSDIVITVSETTRRDVLSLLKTNSTCIPEDSEIKVDTRTVSLDHFSLKEKTYFFYCGNNRPHKNIDFIRRVFENSNDLPLLVLAGKGHKPGHNILSIGNVTDEELSILYKGAISFIFPSLYEGFGLPILEAIKLGTKIVASNISAFMEFKSKNIYYFEINNIQSFKKALMNAQKELFYNDDEFLKEYSREHIYKLNDAMFQKLSVYFKEKNNVNF